MKVAFKTKHLFDGKENKVKKNTSILVENNRIIDLVSNDKIPKGFLVEDLGDSYVLPGLFDCHVHLVWDGSQHPKKVMINESSEMSSIRAVQNAKTDLLHGITTVRDVGGDSKCILAAREAIESGLVKGARIIASGNPLIMTGGHVHEFGLEVDGPHEARKGVRELIKRNVDLIKIMASGGIYGKSESPGNPQMTVEEMSVIVEEAHNAGKKVAAHAEGKQGILNALAAGVDTIEHGNLMDEKIAEDMASRGIYIVPTISTFYHKTAYSELLNKVPPYVIKKAHEVMEGSYKVMEYIQKFNIPLAAGTDDGATAMSHGALIYELELYSKFGLSNFEVLKSATSNAADACGVLDDLGTIEKGKIADFISVDENPLENISALRNVGTVVKEGKIEKKNSIGIEKATDISHMRINEKMEGN